jgi:uncharacterized protein (DUF305 family)
VADLSGLSNLSGRNRTIATVAVGVVVALLAGYVLGWLTTGPSTPGDASAEAGFARDMSAHHAQAVEMGMIAHQKATLADVRTLGGDISLTQQGQIGVMNSWLKEWRLSVNTSRQPMAWMPDGQRALNGNLMPGMATREEVAKLNSASGKDVDILFCQYMLRHHLGGIHMVDGLLAENPKAEVRELAETMKRNQTAEVQVLEGLLTQLGAQPLR